MSEKQDILNGTLCQECKIPLQENRNKDKFGEYVVKPIGYPRFCNLCRDNYIAEMISKVKKKGKK